MADFNVRSDSINVEHIMAQIRARIREKRGSEYTEADIQDLATARLEKFVDPHNVRSDLLEEFHRVRSASDAPTPTDEVVDESVLFETHRPWLRSLRKLLRPILKLFLNTNALAALSLRAKAEVARRSRDQLTFELLHNMVVEITRLNLDVKNLTMRVESMQSRLEFNERRERALESVVVYKPSEPQFADQTPRTPPPAPRATAEVRATPDVSPAPAPRMPQAQGGPPAGADGTGQRRRRRRRRGRRGGGGLPQMGSQPAPDRPVENAGVEPFAVREDHGADAGDAASSPDQDDSASDVDLDPQ